MFGKLKEKLGLFKQKAVEDSKDASPEPAAKEGRVVFGLKEKRVDAWLDELEIFLYESDVAVEVVDEIRQSVKKNLLSGDKQRGRIGDVVEEALKKAMKETLAIESYDLEKFIDSNEKPVVIMFDSGGNFI